jgi:hypothetical protein
MVGDPEVIYFDGLSPSGKSELVARSGTTSVVWACGGQVKGL